MKLRHVVLLLLLANAGYAAWSQGLLRGLGWGPAIQTDPERLAQQVAPDAVTIQAYSPAIEKAAAAPAPEPKRVPATAAAPEASADAPPHETGAVPNSPSALPAPAAPATP